MKVDNMDDSGWQWVKVAQNIRGATGISDTFIVPALLYCPEKNSHKYGRYCGLYYEHDLYNHLILLSFQLDYFKFIIISMC